MNCNVGIAASTAAKTPQAAVLIVQSTVETKAGSPVVEEVSGSTQGGDASDTLAHAVHMCHLKSDSTHP